MDLKNCSTAVFVKNIHHSKAFYCELLGLAIDLDFGKNVILKGGLTLWEIQDHHIIPVRLGTDRTGNNNYNRFEIYFETENLPEIYKKLIDKGVNFLHDLHVEPWGQQTVRFFDPDHHLIEIGETMDQFVGRFLDQGLTPEEVAARTSVPEAEIRKIMTNRTD